MGSGCGDDNFEKLGGYTIRTLATFALHFTKELEHHALCHSAEGEVFSRVMGGRYCSNASASTSSKALASFGPTMAKKLIKPIVNVAVQLTPREAKTKHGDCDFDEY